MAVGITANAAFGKLEGGDRYSGAAWASRSPVLAQQGMAATAQPLASQVAIDVLKKGGSAIDAAIAANAVLGLVEPVSCGIGGDLFAIVWDPKTRALYGYNGSGRSPKGRELKALVAQLGSLAKRVPRLPGGGTLIPEHGSLSISVPGCIDGWFALHGRFGRLPMAELLAPTIAYARDGFPVSQLVAFYWKAMMESFERSEAAGLLEEFDNARATYLVGGHSPKEGELFRNPDLARSLEVIATSGRDAFYKGDVAKAMDAYFGRIGSGLRYDDLAQHQGEWVTPLSVNYRGYDVYELPPNGQGGAALQMLQILEGFDLSKMGAGSADTLTALIEAKRLAFEDLAKWYCDPAFSDIPMEKLLSESYAAARRKLISLDRANPDIGPGDPNLRDGDTTCFCTADRDGMMVSLIQSNFRGMGSGLIPDGLGFMFQDRGALFSLDSSAANVYAPGKRPFHTIIPGFVMKDGAPFLAFGLMGGDMQPQGHVQVLTNIIDFGMNVQEAGDAARWYHSGNTEPTGKAPKGIGTVRLESGFAPEVKEALVSRGYAIKSANGAFGGYQAIGFDAKSRVYWGASEMRKDGLAIGY